MQLGDDADAAAAPHVGGAELDDSAPSPPAWPRYGARRPGSQTGVGIGDPMQALPFDGWPGSATGLYLYVISSHSPGGEHPEVRGLVILPGGIQWLLPSPANVPYGSRRWGLLLRGLSAPDRRGRSLKAYRHP